MKIVRTPAGSCTIDQISHKLLLTCMCLCFLQSRTVSTGAPLHGPPDGMEWPKTWNIPLFTATYSILLQESVFITRILYDMQSKYFNIIAVNIVEKIITVILNYNRLQDMNFNVLSGIMRFSIEELSKTIININN